VLGVVPWGSPLPDQSGKEMFQVGQSRLLLNLFCCNILKIIYNFQLVHVLELSNNNLNDFDKLCIYVVEMIPRLILLVPFISCIY